MAFLFLCTLRYVHNGHSFMHSGETKATSFASFSKAATPLAAFKVSEIWCHVRVEAIHKAKGPIIDGEAYRKHELTQAGETN